MKPFTKLAVIVFSIICLIHLSRLILGWQASINNTEIPSWANIVGALLSALLAVMVWKENK